MAISRVEIQGQVTRAQDFTTIKHQEDHKGLVDQSNFQHQSEQKVEQRLHQVNRGEQTENRQKRFDAKDKGSNAYYGDGGQNRRKPDVGEDGKVLVKGRSSFDIKI